MKKHPAREILEKGGVVDEETFDLMLKEESESNVISVIVDELRDINKSLKDIKEVIGYVETFYDDTGYKYVTLKIPSNQQDWNLQHLSKQILDKYLTQFYV